MRIIGVELRKSFDTRAGFWLLASIGITVACFGLFALFVRQFGIDLLP